MARFGSSIPWKRCVLGAVVGWSAYMVATAFTPSPAPTAEAIQGDGGKALVLRDGRLMEYFIHGDEKGKRTLFAIHGAQTTGKLFELISPWAREQGIRVVSPTLPGYGRSTFQPGYHAATDWVQDATELIEALELKSFAVLGTSLGSIHAAALTALYGGSATITGVELYVAFGPPNEGIDPLEGSVLSSFGKLRTWPWTKRLLEKALLLPMLRTITPKDSDVRRSVTHQWEGAAHCADLIYQPWTFEWKDLTKRCPVFIVSGRKDNVAPPHNQLKLTESIPGSTLLTYDGAHEASLLDVSMFTSHIGMLFA